MPAGLPQAWRSQSVPTPPLQALTTTVPEPEHYNCGRKPSTFLQKLPGAARTLGDDLRALNSFSRRTAMNSLFATADIRLAHYCCVFYCMQQTYMTRLSLLPEDRQAWLLPGIGFKASLEKKGFRSLTHPIIPQTALVQDMPSLPPSCLPFFGCIWLNKFPCLSGLSFLLEERQSEHTTSLLEGTCHSLLLSRLFSEGGAASS